MTDLDGGLSDVARRITARAARMGGDREVIALSWMPYGEPNYWSASIAVLPPRRRGRWVTVRGSSPADVLRKLDAATASLEGQQP